MRHTLVFLLAFAAGCTHDNLGNIDVPDGGGPTILTDGGSATGAPCDPFNVGSCPPAYHCTVSGPPDDAGVGRNTCVPNALKPIPEGGLCQQISFRDLNVTGDLCEPGTMCMRVTTGLFRCARPCFLHDDCGAANQACAAFTPVLSPTMTKFQGQDVSLKGCVHDENCNPVEQSGCLSSKGQRCVFGASDGEFRARVCVDWTGTRVQGANCQSSTECAAGFICGGLGFCLQLCYQNPPADARLSGACPSPYVCSPFSGSTATYGRCE